MGSLCEAVQVFMTSGADLGVEGSRRGSPYIIDPLTCPHESVFYFVALFKVQKVSMDKKPKEHPKLARLVQEIPWGQNIVILQMVKDLREREYYIRATADVLCCFRLGSNPIL